MPCVWIPRCVFEGCYLERLCTGVNKLSVRFHHVEDHEIMSFIKVGVATEIWLKRHFCPAVRLLLTTVLLGALVSTLDVSLSSLCPLSPSWSSHQQEGPPPRSLPTHMFLLKVSRSFTGKMGTGAGRRCNPIQTWAGIEPRTPLLLSSLHLLPFSLLLFHPDTDLCSLWIFVSRRSSNNLDRVCWVNTVPYLRRAMLYFNCKAATDGTTELWDKYGDVFLLHRDVFFEYGCLHSKALNDITEPIQERERERGCCREKSLLTAALPTCRDVTVGAVCRQLTHCSSCKYSPQLKTQAQLAAGGPVGTFPFHTVENI